MKLSTTKASLFALSLTVLSACGTQQTERIVTGPKEPQAEEEKSKAAPEEKQEEKEEEKEKSETPSTDSTETSKKEIEPEEKSTFKDSKTEEFNEVMKHIFLVEGGCSNHPNDSGGKTFRGITTATARSYGWTGDVCQLPKDKILKIYHERYWSKRAVKFDWPLSLAVMNTEVNSGGGTAQTFLDRMKTQGVSGTLEKKALWFVDQQTAKYKGIIAANPSQRVFEKGWMRRSAYMKDVIQGLPASYLADPGLEFEFSGAKAY
jgi:hypothetical protein